ncbi:hypothetical protein [Paenibacillus antibioticophila]|uniref:hypothetical protein n=1 Tax=Paenibacillus antibioticophila TaxID=1274374 RepID=UPI0005CA8D3F|nr:hypothetical protein [Paenibacillus antibioticophila]
MKKQSLLLWILGILSVIGILAGLFGYGRQIRLMDFLIPIILIAVIFFLYRFPPGKARKRSPKIKPSARTMAKVAQAKRGNTSAAKKRKSYPFQVIEGNKGKKSDDDVPKYH